MSKLHRLVRNGMFTFFLFVSGPVLANDLIIEDFRVNLLRNGEVVAANSDLVYLADTDNLIANVDMEVSWDCIVFAFSVCSQIRPDFTARVELHAVNGAFQRTIVVFDSIFFDGSTDVQYRGDSTTSEIRSVQHASIQNLVGFNSIMAEARHYGDTLVWRLVIDTLGTVTESDFNGENNNTSEIDPLTFWPMSGKFDYGVFPTTGLTQINNLSETIVCQTSSGTGGSFLNVLVDIGAVWDPSSTDSWAPVPLQKTGVCAEYKLNGEALSLTALGPTEAMMVFDVNGTLGGLDVTLTNAELVADTGLGGGALIVQLPDGVSSHSVDLDEGGPQELGYDTLWMYGVTLSDVNNLDTLQSTYSNFGGYLHSETLPFSLRINNLSLNSSGLTGTYGSIHYVYDRAHDMSDNRHMSQSGPISNDRRFSNPAVPSLADDDFAITNSGLQVSKIVFDSSGTTSSHFPRVSTVNNSAFAIGVSNSRLDQSQLPVNVDAYSLLFSTDCPSCDSGVVSSVIYDLVPVTQEVISSDGAVSVDVNSSSRYVDWGPYVGPGHVFRLDRGGFPSTGTLYLPGHIVAGTGQADGLKVSDSLMGVRQLSITVDDNYLPATHFSLNTENAQRGNYAMPGLTFGPELYSFGSGKLLQVGNGRNLVGTGINVGLGGLDTPDFISLSAIDATKYVMRSGGLTGVFNTNDSPTATVYGYNLNFSSFSFRQVSNKIDSYSWINGDFHIPGKGVFDVVFDSLGLECSGDLAGGVIAYEGRPGNPECSDGDSNGNGYADENCTESFSAWNAAIELLTLEFVVDDASLPSCSAQSRTLKLGNTIAMLALDRPLGMQAKWSSTGEPTEASVSGVTNHILDRPKGVGVPETENKGFDVALRSGMALRTPSSATGVENTSVTDGWLALTAEVSLPFWERLDVSARIANSIALDGEQEETVITEKDGHLTGSVSEDDKLTNASLSGEMQVNTSSNFKADYKWGRTDFGFNLPVYYAAGHATGNEADRQKPMFLGRTQSKKLAIMDVNAGINFVTPENTKLSFGASADFERLPQLDDLVSLHIDFNDPDTIKKVDAFLCAAPIGCSSIVSERPIATVFGELNSQFAQLNEVVGAGLDEALEQGVNSALDNPPVNLLLEGVSDTLGLVHALPDRLGSFVASGFGDIADEMAAPLGAELDQEMLSLYVELPAVLRQAQISGPVGLEAQLEGYISTLDSVINAVGSAHRVAESADQRITDVEETIGATLDGVTDAAGETAKAVAAIDLLSAKLSEVSTTNLSVCSFDVDDPQLSSNALLGKVADVHKRLSSIQFALQGFNLVQLGEVFSAAAGIDLESFNTASREINNRIEDLNATFSQVQAGIDDLCDPINGLADELSTMVDTAQNLLDTLKANVLLVDTAVADLRTALIDDQFAGTTAVLKSGVSDVRNQLEGAISMLTTLRETVVAATNGQIGEYDFRAIGDASVIQQKLDELMRDSVGAAFSWRYPAFESEPASSFVLAFGNTIRQAVDVAIASAVQLANAKLATLVNTVPQPSPDDLRQLLVNLIMNSNAIESIDIEVNRQLSRVLRPMTNVIVVVSDQINYVLQELALALAGKAQEALELAVGEVPDMPVGAGRIDGFGLITGDELERVHLAAEWNFNQDTSESGTAFNAAFDLINLSASTEAAGCTTGLAPGTFSAVISSTQLPITIGESESTLRELKLGFLLETNGLLIIPKGLFGGISLDGDLDYETFTLYDLAFAAGVSPVEGYLGASGGALFDELQFNAAFLVGKTCAGSGVLHMLDPDALIGDPDGAFSGVYVRGATSMPVWNNGCALTVSVGADVGAWVLTNTPLTYGGLVGGSASGKVACVASLRGKLLVGGEKSGDQFRFFGEGFGVGGVGWDCNPGSWTTVPRSRKDDWCGTGDARFEAEYKDGWDIPNPKTSAIH